MSFILDNLSSLAVGAIVALVLFFVIRSMVKDRKSGKSSCSGCTNCSGGCGCSTHIGTGHSRNSAIGSEGCQGHVHS